MLLVVVTGGLEVQKLSNWSREDEKALTEYEQEYVKVFEEKVHHNEHVEALIDTI
jgi:hypothetical protein